LDAFQHRESADVEDVHRGANTKPSSRLRLAGRTELGGTMKTVVVDPLRPPALLAVTHAVMTPERAVRRASHDARECVAHGMRRENAAGRARERATQLVTLQAGVEPHREFDAVPP